MFVEVMPPDEWHYPVNNSVYTNHVARQALLMPKFVCKLLNCTPPDEYEEIANKIYLPFDAEEQYHPEYDGFTKSSVVVFSYSSQLLV